jgi:hypothetical protein
MNSAAEKVLVREHSKADPKTTGSAPAADGTEMNSRSDKIPVREHSKAAVAIQRIARGVGARGSILRIREEKLAEEQFTKTLDPLLSPAENASRSLWELASVT